MREEDVRREGSVALLHEVVPERAQSTAGIEDYEMVAPACNADAGRVSAVTRRIGAGCRD
jgi:hypothetical protein